MTEDFGESITTDNEGYESIEKKNKIWIVVAVVVVILCCSCIILGYGGWWLWNNGDEIFGLASRMSLSLF
jgi:hypothetical protein